MAFRRHDISDDSIVLQDGHPAVNVKVYRLDTPSGYTEDDGERAYESTREGFWRDATSLAEERGYSGVFSEGRSGGWCVPFRVIGPAPIARYPDVTIPAERERFRVFQRDIRRLLGEVQARYLENLEVAKETREDAAKFCGGCGRANDKEGA